MTVSKAMAVAGLVAATLVAGSARADDMLGSYVARISDRDHRASDGYPLSSAAQMVRQDRANWHKFHRRDSDDQGDPWFRSDGSRADLQRMLERGGAMSSATRRAIVNGEPLIEVDVYSDSVRVSIVED
ncbi:MULTISPECIES: hypothetical protein [unclassified Mesorhizobium]|nr:MULTISPECIES: hypothetical protein [unclassified Mesorhizobium]AZO05915.1 hypothetical protein EJ068_24735 [Mesorhizobium sp. M2A.F.Ca.ET.043.02.1.1]RUW34564.1 hypothetical protein EOA37_29340 [Mesorhizobium sp. M2A.F.Ca.ET.015.02.1.1]RUW67996.1 hypothetical protein EOA28_28015 [Mesorhizobium sp. M2A.F.Ca.ET.067.02.1.1]RVC90594.1 hypothetical protein EN739_32965 [Mesorhizobium sp. M2A.F.Ca.ET.017.03.2.1]RVD08259.1 hypothetical protein EN753_14750 [Mesorhizobium sp. M2A.F.Ca.ET.029.05.1.1]